MFSVLEVMDDWIIIWDVVIGFGDDYGDGKGGKVVMVCKMFKCLEMMGLIEFKCVGYDCCYY